MIKFTVDYKMSVKDIAFYNAHKLEEIDTYITEDCSKDENAVTTFAEMYAGYRAWCKRNNRFVVGKNDFFYHISCLGLQPVYVKGKPHWAGLRVDTVTAANNE